MKNIKKGIFIACGFIAIFFIINITTYAVSEKTLLDVFFSKDTQEQKDYMKEQMVLNGESIEYDGYIFTLEQHLFDQKTGTGCIQVSVQKDGADMTKFQFDENKDWYPRFGEDSSLRFALAPEIGLEVSAEVKTESNKFTIYSSFLNDSTKRSNKIFLYDYQKGEKAINYVVAEFELENQDYSIEVSGEKWAHLFISYNIIQILWPTETITDFSLGMKNGTEIAFFENGKVLSPLEECSKKGGSLTIEEIQNFGNIITNDVLDLYENKVEDIVCFKPKNSIDLQQVQYVIVNGKKYMCEVD